MLGIHKLTLCRSFTSCDLVFTSSWMCKIQRLSELFEFGNPERIPKSSGSGVRSEGLFSVGIRSEVVQFGRSENPEFPNPENIDLLS